MFRSVILVRNVHISHPNWSSIKAQLLTLRKKTGYPFETCKKALQLNDNSIEKSEAWLVEEAQRRGWSKANKFANRATAQGVISMAVDSKNEIAAIVEVNCETDFVARNKCFQSVVDVITSSCLDFAKTQKALENSFSKVNLKSNELMALNGTKNKTLADHVVGVIGNLGENITLRRATCLNTQNTGLNIMGLTHPSNATGSHFFFGKYGSLLIYRKQKNLKINTNGISHDEILRQMCQHVIGMNPKVVGTLDTHQKSNKSPEVVPDITFNENDDSSLDNIDEKFQSDVEKDSMLEQDFLLDPSITVGQVVTDYGIDVIDFVRYECGQT